MVCYNSRGKATAAAAEAPRAARQSASFTLNLFRGQFEPAQVFPFPEPLSEDQRQTLVELVPPVEKFFQEVHLSQIISYNWIRIRIFDYGVPSVPVEHISLRQCHVVWRKHEGGCTVKEIMLHNRRMHVKKKRSS